MWVCEQDGSGATQGADQKGSAMNIMALDSGGETMVEVLSRPEVSREKVLDLLDGLSRECGELQNLSWLQMFADKAANEIRTRTQDHEEFTEFHLPGVDLNHSGLDVAPDQLERLCRIENENLALRDEIEQAEMFEEIVGTAPVLREVLARVARVAPTDSTVLITGETGTGKELIARAIHKHSKRSGKPFISVNCAAIPKDLIASELFGHERGAFTGALQRRIGRFEQAEGGTIFLDEIGELPAETQVALLRVLQEREFERVGGTHPIAANVRVIAATNRDLPAAITAGT